MAGPDQTPEYVTVPAAILGPVIDTHIGQALRGYAPQPKVRIAFSEIFPDGTYRAIDDPARITAESAFWLAYYADAENLYGAGAEARANAAIEAEYGLFRAVHNQAPATEVMCDCELEAMYGEIKASAEEGGAQWA